MAFYIQLKNLFNILKQQYEIKKYKNTFNSSCLTTKLSTNRNQLNHCFNFITNKIIENLPF